MVFKLVVRGGGVFAEKESAVKETYKNWKSGNVKEFNICDHITSGIGMGFCATRANERDKKRRQAKLMFVEGKLDNNAKELLDKAYKSAVKFIEMKVAYEEGHGGTGTTAWIIESEMEQKNKYLDLIADVQDGFVPQVEGVFDEIDRNLKKLYEKAIWDLKLMEQKSSYLPRVDQLRDIQRFWEIYINDSVKLFLVLNPSIDEARWRTLLTEFRIKQLKVLLDNIDFMS